jgi:hypothetical protein
MIEQLVEKYNETEEIMKKLAERLVLSKIEEDKTYWLWEDMLFDNDEALNDYLMENHEPIGLLDDDYTDYIHEGVYEAEELTSAETKELLEENITEIKTMF